MINALLILFMISLLYLSIITRMRTFIQIISFQGLLLFGLFFLGLTEISATNLTIILLETLIFKAIAVPAFIDYVIDRNKITREVEPYLPNFISLINVTAIILIIFLMSTFINDTSLKKSYFIVALSALFIGLYILLTRRKVITHFIGYLVIENGVSVLTLAVGSEMPLFVNLGIMLDIFVSVLILGIFINKIGDVLKDVDINQLRNIKD